MSDGDRPGPNPDAHCDGGDPEGGTHRDAGFDDWLDAVAAGEGYYLRCPAGHGSLPPRRGCPECGARDLAERSLPAVGTVETYTTIHVAAPEFAAEVPYVTVVASFGPVRLTGVLRGVDPADVAVGTAVEPAVGEREGTGGRVLELRPR